MGGLWFKFEAIRTESRLDGGLASRSPEFAQSRPRNDPRPRLMATIHGVKARLQDAELRAWSNSWSAFSASNCAAKTSNGMTHVTCNCLLDRQFSHCVPRALLIKGCTTSRNLILLRACASHHRMICREFAFRATGPNLRPSSSESEEMSWFSWFRILVN